MTIIRRKEAAKALGIGVSTLDEWQKPKSRYYKPDFPKKIKLGNKSTGFLKSEIDSFIDKLREAAND